MSTQQQPIVKYKTVCRVPGCGQDFVSSPLDIPIIGQPNARVVHFVTKLMEHVQQKHPAIMQQISGALQEYTGFLVLTMFQWQDPQLQKMHESVRASIHKVSTRFTISDDEIQDRIARLGLEPEQEEGLNTLLRDMRDLLTEQGRYAPQNGQPAATTVVTV